MNLPRVALAAAFAACCFAQPAAPKFEVASVKFSAEASPRQSRFNRTPGGGLNAYNIPLRSFILIAYHISEFQLSNAPGWIETERYDIIAKPADAEVADSVVDNTFTEAAYNRLELRLQNLLAERFGLLVHRATTEMPVYVLVAGKSGIRVPPSKDDEVTNVEMRSTGLKCTACSLKMFAETIITHQVGRPVVDRTGRTGNFTFELTFVPTAGTPAVAGEGPTLFEALHEQLGLRLESQKAAVQMVVIDHVQRPSPN